MIDVNSVVRGVLNDMAAAHTADSVTVTYYHPNEKNKLPVVSYYELTTPTGFSYDNAERAQNSYVAVDVWGKSGAQTARIAIDVDTAMQNDGWRREFSRDLAPEDGVYHKNMRYQKMLYFD